MLSEHAAVTQKYLIVTCNQAARRLGVTKLQGITGVQRTKLQTSACMRPRTGPVTMLVPQHGACRDMHDVACIMLAKRCWATSDNLLYGRKCAKT